MSAILEPRGLTWWGDARAELQAADLHSSEAQGALTPVHAYFALYQIEQARERLAAAEAKIRKTIRSLDGVATAEL